MLSVVEIANAFHMVSILSLFFSLLLSGDRRNPKNDIWKFRGKFTLFVISKAQYTEQRKLRMVTLCEYTIELSARGMDYDSSEKLKLEQRFMHAALGFDHDDFHLAEWK